MKQRTHVASILFMILFYMAAGCADRSWKDWNAQPGLFSAPWTRQKQIGKVEQYRREFGEISLSKPVVVSKPEKLKIDFQLSAKEIYNDIGLQAASRVGQFEAVSFRGAAKFEAATIPEHTVTPVGPAAGLGAMQALVDAATKDPKPENLEILASVLKAGIEAAKPLAEPVTIPEQKALGAPDLPENISDKRAKEFFDAAKVFDPLSSLRLNTVTRLTETANAHYHLRLHEIFSDIEQFKLDKEDKVVLLAGFITVSPGSITGNGFTAECVLKLQVGNAVGMSDVPVISLFPSAIGQNMDLQSLFALQRSLAIKLQAAGFVFGGTGQFDWSQIDSLNTRSLNQRVTISAFNRGHSNQIGWRIRGEYWAASPNAKWQGRLIDPGDAVLMQDVNVPILMVGIVPKDIAKTAEVTMATIANPQQDSTKGIAALKGEWTTAFRNTESFHLPEGNNDATSEPTNEALPLLSLKPMISIAIETRWIPEYEDSARSYPEISSIEGLYRAEVADDLTNSSCLYCTSMGDKNHCKHIAPPKGHYRNTAEPILRESLRHAIAPIYSFTVSYPRDAASKSLALSDAHPLQLPFDRASAMVLTGDGFNKDMQVFVGPLVAKVLTVSNDKTIAAVVVDPTSMSSRLPVGGRIQIVAANGQTTLKEKEASFLIPPERPDKARTTFEFKTDGKPDRTLDVSDTGGGAKAEALKAFDPSKDKDDKK